MNDRKALVLTGTVAAIGFVVAGVLFIETRSQFVTAHPQLGPVAVIERHHGAGLQGANLSGAKLTGASLRGADLRHASLASASLQRADLRNADLRDATLSGA